MQADTVTLNHHRQLHNAAMLGPLTQHKGAVYGVLLTLLTCRRRARSSRGCPWRPTCATARWLRSTRDWPSARAARPCWRQQGCCRQHGHESYLLFIKFSSIDSTVCRVRVPLSTGPKPYAYPPPIRVQYRISNSISAIAERGSRSEI